MSSSTSPASIVYIIHGYQATPDSHWFPWLKQMLEAEGHQVEVLALPGPNTPKFEGWLDHLRANITRHDAQSFFIGHSLGCITLLRHLESQQDAVGGMVLVSGFAEPLSFLPALDSFTAEPLNTEHLKNIVPQRLVMAAQDDNIVPYPYSLRLAEKLAAEWELFEDGGHFMAEDGFTEFPALYDAISQMLPRQ